MLIDSKQTTTNDNFQAIEASLTSARERAVQLTKDVEELETKLRHARGTGDVTAQAAKAVAPPTIAQKIETALRANVFALPELAKAIGETTGKTGAAIRAMRKNLGNLGTPARARWVWRIGEQATTAELTDMIKHLISDQPLTTAELVAVTGVRLSRVSGALVAIQRSGMNVYNLGTPHRHRWFVVPSIVRGATLPPKKESGQ